jgi:flagellar basal-body rod modification protein FlgD
MLKLQQLTQGADLIGKTVTYTPTGGGADVSGKVDSVAVQGGQFVLQVGTDSVGLDQITNVKA